MTTMTPEETEYAVRGLSGREAVQRHLQSTTDSDARLMRKGPGKEAKLVLMAHALMSNGMGW